MKKLLIFIPCLILSIIMAGQAKLQQYLPSNIKFNEQIPTPQQFIGHEVGEWHITHDKLYYYMLELSKNSERAEWEEYARSYENRPLGYLIVSSPQNIRNLEKIRQQNLFLCDPDRSATLDINNMPIIITLGYGVHGNESSAQNASLLIAYYLVAGQDPRIDELLEKTVILIDPCLNPDGMQRHSTWVNSMKSHNNISDPNSLEFHEPWPGGRVNHYWFDLNRDWLMLQHPETIGRVEAFFKWRPTINTDHHEMSAHSTFYFQPGITSRNNPLVPKENQELTAEIAKFNEKYLNETSTLFFTEEGFDDYYLGKGSSYHDINGSISLSFEQAGVKGHLRETPSGLLSFPSAIKNQLTVSLATLEAGMELREKLLENQRRFYTSALENAKKHETKAYILTESFDHARFSIFIDILLKHQIEIYNLDKDVIKNGIHYNSANSYIVPLEQKQFRLIRSLFEPVKEFQDSIFYDVSTWVLPMSFNISYAEIKTEKEMAGLAGSIIEITPPLEGNLITTEKANVYLFDWDEYFAPKALYFLQNSDLKVKVCTDEFVIEQPNFKKKFSYGTILVTTSNQKLNEEEIKNLLASVAIECGIKIYGVNTSMTSEGIDLGSNSFRALEKPEIIMLVGKEMKLAQTGEIWHMLDYKFDIPVTRVIVDRLKLINLNKYNVLIIAGSPIIDTKELESIKRWNRSGGTLIAYGDGNDWLVKNKLADIEFVPQTQIEKTEGRYIDSSTDKTVQEIGGAIFETRLELTHPLCYGYKRKTMPVMKTGVSVAKRNTNIYNNPITYTNNPLLSGYCTQMNQDRIRNNAFASVHGSRIISIYDHTNFRSIWYGTNKVFLNAVFFGQIL